MHKEIKDFLIDLAYILDKHGATLELEATTEGEGYSPFADLDLIINERLFTIKEAHPHKKSPEIQSEKL